MTGKELRLSAVTTCAKNYNQAKSLIDDVKYHYDKSIESAMAVGCTMSEINSAVAKAKT